jgi:hypothetical protein
LSKIVTVWTALFAVGSGATALAELRDGGQAMMCCAKTDYSCAGMRAPDDCCRIMGHAAAHQVPATIEKHKPPPTATAIPAGLSLHVFVSFARMRSVTPFTRPHDPPHLHPFALLI